MAINLDRVIVTGGAGFIGSHVVDRLVSGGSDVVVIDDLSIGSRSNLQHHAERAVQLQVADIRDMSAMKRLVRNADMVIHMAVASLRVSINNPLSVHEVNATGTLNVWQSAVENGIARAIYVSSSEAYGSALVAPMDESHPLEPTTVYGASKAAGELYAQSCQRSYGVDTIVVRPFNSYGPREHAEGTSAEVIPKFVLRVLAGQPPVIFGDGLQTRDFTWVEDTAQGIVDAACSDKLVGEAVNIARGEEVSILEVARHVLRAVGREDLEIDHQDERPGDVSRHLADVTKARTELGFSADVPFADGIERYVEWVRRYGPDPKEWLGREQLRNW